MKVQSGYPGDEEAVKRRVMVRKTILVALDISAHIPYLFERI